MERKIVVASHGDGAKGITDTVRMILGEIKTDIEVFTLLPGGNASTFAQQLEKDICSHTNKEFVILCDIYGASVCSSMYTLVDYENVRLFSGVNVNMLLSICLEYPNRLTDEDAKKIVQDACAGIRWLRKEETTEEEF